MSPAKDPDKLGNHVLRDIRRILKARREQNTLLGQTVYLGTVGFMIALPLVGGAYLGNWLDQKLPGYSFSWTISLIFAGLVLGVVNVYFFLRE